MKQSALIACAVVSVLGLAQPSLRAQTPAPAPARSTAIVEAVHRSGAAARCWNAFLQSDPNAPSVRFRVRVDVNAQGAVQRVAVMDPAPTVLVTCVQTQLRQLSLARGEPITVETTYSFAAGSPAPVPAGASSPSPSP